MICVPGLGFNSYAEQLSGDQPLPEIPCPDPACFDCLLRGHGWYRRYLNGLLQAIRRLRCPRCRVTHALLPEDVCAYRDVTFSALESALETEGPSAGARAAQQPGRAGRRRVRRWLRAQQSPWAVQLMGLLPAAVVGCVWERIKTLANPPPGTLVGLRHWLWSTYRYFFSGLTGLFRHGRPGFCGRGDSTDFGICAESS